MDRWMKVALVAGLIVLVAVTAVGLVQLGQLENDLDGLSPTEADRAHYGTVKRDPALWLAPPGTHVSARFDPGVCGDSGGGPHFTWYLRSSADQSPDVIVEELRRRLTAMGWSDRPEATRGSGARLEFDKSLGGRLVVIRARDPFEPDKSTLDVSLDAQAGTGCGL